MEIDVESGAESSLSPSEANQKGTENEEDDTPKIDPLKWTVIIAFVRVIR